MNLNSLVIHIKVLHLSKVMIIFSYAQSRFWPQLVTRPCRHYFSFFCAFVGDAFEVGWPHGLDVGEDGRVVFQGQSFLQCPS